MIKKLGLLLEIIVYWYLYGPYVVSNNIIDICDRPPCLQGQLISWYLSIFDSLVNI